VRLSGQDCGRGTFSQRHSVIVDQTPRSATRRSTTSAGARRRYEVIDSPALGRGGARLRVRLQLAEPERADLWEAQFGDFANGAQIMIDQFISRAKAKWLRMSGLVMLLPHGYEGQGPEHSSARLERYPAALRRGQLAGRN
jgi:2-oxoglutarate dehydrogenase E1 component